jgi:hydroxymethylbilane synthase
MHDVPTAARPLAPHQLAARGTPLRVGTRGSPLALVQCRTVLAALRRLCPDSMDGFEERVITTSGDAAQASGRRLAELGGKGLWAKEIHEALLDRRIDFAVHSLKDLETTLPAGIALGCVLPREDARDALILGPGCTAPDPEQPLAALPAGAVVGSSSVRRQAQLLHARPDLRIVPMRGNVATRLEKLAQGMCDATLLAMAGLCRLGLGSRAAAALEVETMVPAAGQGIIGVTVRADDSDLCTLLAAIEDAAARAAADAERALLAEVDGSCRTPIGAHARPTPGGELEVTGLIARVDGSFLLRDSRSGPPAEARRIGRELGSSLRAASPRDIFA